MNSFLKNKKVENILYVFFFFCILVITFILRFKCLLQTYHPTGLDGYYYALQAKSLATTGALENPDYEIGYYICGFFAFLFKDAILGCKIWAALSSTLLCLAVSLLVKQFTKLPVLSFASLLICCFCSPSLVSFQVNYINNQTGLLFFFMFATCFTFIFENFKNFSTNKKIIFSILSFIFLILSVLSHLVSTAFCFIFICLMLVRKFSLKKQIILISGAGILFILLFINRIERFKSVFALLPILPCFSKVFMNILPKSIPIEMTIYFILNYFLVILYIIKIRKFNLFLLIPLIISFPFWNLTTLDMGYRILLNGIPVSICFDIIILSKLINFNDDNLIIKELFLLILTITATFTHKVYDGTKDPPYSYYKKIVEKIDLPKDSLLIAHLGLNHCYTYYCDLKDCLNYNCDFEVPGNEVWRLAYGTNADYLKQFFGEYEEDELNILIRQIDTNYVLIKEDLWQRYLKYEEDEIVESLNNWYNPHEYRPSFIRKK